MLKDHIAESIELQKMLLESSDLIDIYRKSVETIIRAFQGGNKILVAGNGGSAADAQHFAAEFVGKFKMIRKGYPAISLTVNASALTAWSNDNSFDGVFARQIEALGTAGDVFFGITTSGNSKNILAALAKARQMKIFTVTFLGGDGGKAKGMADLEFVIPSKNTPRVQEMHMLVLHSIAEEAEKRMVASDI